MITSLDLLRHAAREFTTRSPTLVPFGCDPRDVLALFDEVDRLRVQVGFMAQAPDAALDIAFRSGGVEGDHHRAWVIDQMVRALTGAGYEAWVRIRKRGPDGPDDFGWDEGIAP